MGEIRGRQESMPEEGEMGETAALVPTGNRPFGQEEKFALAIFSRDSGAGEKTRFCLFSLLLLACLCQILPPDLSGARLCVAW